MDKFNISARIQLRIGVRGKSRFSKTFADRLVELAKEAGKETGASVSELTADEVHVCVEVECKGGMYDNLSTFTNRYLEKVRLLANHGRDADILTTILEKYPELKNNPRVGEIVGSFNILSSKIDEIRKDESSTLAIRRQENEKRGIDPLQNLGRPTPHGPRKSNAEIAAHREAALLGQAEGQERGATFLGNTAAPTKVVQATPSDSRGTYGIMNPPPKPPKKD